MKTIKDKTKKERLTAECLFLKNTNIPILIENKPHNKFKAA